MPCLSTVMPWEAWYFGRGAKPGAPSPFKWTYHFGFGGGEFYQIRRSGPPADKQEGRTHPYPNGGCADKGRSRT